MNAEQEILFRHCRLDTVNQLLWRGSRVIPLRQKSFAVLRYLLEHAGQLATKEELLRAVWPETYVSDIVLKVCIRELRHALGDQREAPQFIETVHRRGYRFIAPLSTNPQPVRSVKFKVQSARPKVRGLQSAIRNPLRPGSSTGHAIAGGGLFPAGPRPCARPKREGVGVADGDELESVVAPAGQEGRRPSDAGGDL